MCQRRQRASYAEFPSCDLPPLETANWLRKPAALVRGTWPDARAAARWLGDRLTEYAPRFAAPDHRVAGHLSALIASAEARLRRGGDVSLGYYLERPTFLSLALVACSPNDGDRASPCPMS
ncbi:hypothetical protein [Streptomyces tendae]|uniref:hypothetical protein n=1 Tax=Streptomyces tendae TaxID=1932 RepID=UPI003711CD7E